MIVAEPAMTRTSWASIALNLFLAINMWWIGGLCWLALVISGDWRAAQSGHLRVIVEVDDGDWPVMLDLRVPLALLKAAVRVARLMPIRVRTRVNGALRDEGIDIDIAQLPLDVIDELIDALHDTSVDVVQPREDVLVLIFGE